MYLLLSVSLVMASLVGGASTTDGTADAVDIVKIVSVVAFVGGMITLAMTMVGDAF